MPPGGPTARLLPDGRRLHLQHGPIDLIVEATGTPAGVSEAYGRATDRFRTVLQSLVDELPLLRAPLAGDHPPDLQGPVARRMLAACWPHRAVFVTPMAAVAGAVADEMLAALVAGADGAGIETAYVNNGGDIAIHLAPGRRLRLGIVGDADAPAIDAKASLDHASPVRGIATSGWRGRSWSLGIADAVTVLARNAATADVCATLIANAVTAEDPAIERRPACAVDDNTDLGDRPVTVAVGALAPDTVAAALDAGAAAARSMVGAGHVIAAMVVLRDGRRVIGEGSALLAGR